MKASEKLTIIAEYVNAEIDRAHTHVKNMNYAQMLDEMKAQGCVERRDLVNKLARQWGLEKARAERPEIF